MHGQEIGGKTQFANQGQLLVRLCPYVGGHPGGKTPFQSGLAQTFQPGLRRLPVTDLIRIFIGKLIKGKGAAIGNINGPAQGGRVKSEHASHVRNALQPPFPVGQGPGANIIYPYAGPDTGQHIRQPPPPAAVHQHIPHRHHGQCQFASQPGPLPEPELVLSVIAGRCPQKHMPRKATPHLLQMPANDGRTIHPGTYQPDENQPLPIGMNICLRQMAAPFFRPPLAPGQQTGQPGIGRTIPGQCHPFHITVRQHQPCTHQHTGQGLQTLCCLLRQLFSRTGCRHLLPDTPLEFLQGGMGPHHPCKGIPVHYGNGLQAKLCRPDHQFLRMGCPPQKGKIGHDTQFGIRTGRFT